MSRRTVFGNAQEALEQLKEEMAAELGVDGSQLDTGDLPSRSIGHYGGIYGGKIGGQMTRRLIEMGEQQLTRRK
ncbi:small, acid-soluble spore protein, alpha/beta type [Geosporobacter ferrireducens]|uniref:small, acid-soluble spore protein, alpha/beta type n=1 Tax=Geosporobacter ferrireducens TaxID=1424294 RepID=UPI00139E4266|nr:small, acid-soluble spore protein, alpha/beta type [Geosporobacter ferrireducens]MTI55784.1 alpha/beta-type small acid-soluble spore protein [Geosporobacter ferrireducens]